MRSFTSTCITTVVCCPCGRRAASASQPASTSRRNASPAPGSGGRFGERRSSSWSRFHSAINASWCDCSAASNLAASSLGRVIFQVVECPSLVLVIDALAFGLRLGVGSRFEFDRGAQLADRGDLGQRRIMLIRTVGCPLGDHADLIERQPALPQARNAAGKLRRPAGDGSDGVRVGRRRTGLPCHQRGDRAAPGVTPQPVAIDLGDDVHDARVDRVALTGQLRQLFEQHLKPRLTRRRRNE